MRARHATVTQRARAGRWLLAAALLLACEARAYKYTISPPIVAGQVPAVAAAPLRKEEALRKQDLVTLANDQIFVEGRRDPEARMPAARTVEQKFADALNAGNPEVPGGTIRHGTFYDGVFYWGNDPLSFVYLNVKNRLID